MTPAAPPLKTPAGKGQHRQEGKTDHGKTETVFHIGSFICSMQ
jgi:hypothetical protein